MALVIKDLNKEFGAKAVFSGFNYTFEDSGLYVVSGESGIGKTTLLRLIAGLDTEFKGKINNFGNKPSMMFQEYRLFPHLTALENIVLTVSNTKSEAVMKKAEAMLARLGFSEDQFNLYPDEMSGGMKQRVSLCRALLYDCPILLLDEPAKELDYANARQAYEIIAEYSSSKLVIMVTHNFQGLEGINYKTIHLS